MSLQFNLWVSIELNGYYSIQGMNTSNFNISKEIIVGNSPRGILIAPNGFDLWVVNNGDGTIQLVNLYTLIPNLPITVGSGAAGGANFLAISPDGSTLWVSNIYDETVQPININTMTVGSPINVSGNPAIIQISPDGSTLWVMLENTNTIQSINIQTLTANTPITVGASGNYVEYITISPDGSTVWVSFGNSLVSINTSTLAVSAPITLNYTPVGLIFSNNGNTLYVLAKAGTNSQHQTQYAIQELNIQTLTIENTLLIIGEAIYGVLLNNYIYNANVLTGNIDIIDLTSFTLYKSILLNSVGNFGDIAISNLISSNYIIMPPTLIHNILNCEPINHVLSSETGVDK